MPEIVSHVAIVSLDPGLRSRWIAGLNRVAAEEPAAPAVGGFRFLPVNDAEAALAMAARDGLLQVVVIDSATVDRSRQLVLALKDYRPELDLFLAVAPGGGRPAGLPAALLDREDDKPGHLFRQLKGAVQARARTPFADTLQEYVYSAPDAWHTPGHSGGDSLRESAWVTGFYRMMGEHIFTTDLSVSVQALDSLLEPHSVIQEAQDLAAAAFGARRTFFVTNGTSTANKVIVQHLLGSGGGMIVDRGCHKSIHHAIILYGVEPTYLPASLQPEYGFYGPVTRRRVFEAIDANPEARLLVLTSCTYDGFYYDLKPIIDYAHGRGVKVMIDEAWYAHGRFHPQLRPNALECGADYVTQSTHKMLSAFSQASMIHVGDPDFDEYRFREDLNMHTSTSPQYAMIASLDVARKQMSMEGFSLLSRCIRIGERLRQEINDTGVFRVLSLEDMLPAELADDGIRLDPTKLSIDVSASGWSARRIQLELFGNYGIQVEKVTHNTLSVLVTLGATESKVLRLVSALQKLAARAPGSGAPRRRRVKPLPAPSELVELPRRAYFGATEELPLESDQHGLNPELPGRASADLVVPYPPGIPVLVPGQVITEEIAGFLLDLCRSDQGIEIHGLRSEEGESRLRVVAR